MTGSTFDKKILSTAIEESVARSGPTPAAVWLDKSGALDKGLRRCDAIFRMMSERQGRTILDLGCGPGLAIPYLEERHGPMHDRYLGIDISEQLLEAARKQWPRHAFEARDIVANTLPARSHDFCAINGVLTSKYTMSFAVMENFAKDLLRAAWAATNVALSFNVMSPHVDWAREDLFHWPMDSAAAFCIFNLSRHVNIIADYALYEYTVQVFREPHESTGIPPAWQTAG
jgi:SAM-dependent methyltransferase